MCLNVGLIQTESYRMILPLVCPLVVTYVFWAKKYIASETHDRAVAQPVNSADPKGRAAHT